MEVEASNHSHGIISESTIPRIELTPVRKRTVKPLPESYVDVGFHSRASESHRNEDNWAVIYYMDIVFTFVFDGHGGHQTSQWLARMADDEDPETNKFFRLESLVNGILDMDGTVREMTFAEVQYLCDTLFHELDKELLDHKMVGSTAVIGVHNVVTGKAYFIHVGDSRAAYCLYRQGNLGDVVTIVGGTSDHKPCRPDENMRIVNAGGWVAVGASGGDMPRVNGIIGVSRAFGDHALKPHVSSRPEVTGPVYFKSGDCYVLGSDGLWDEHSNEEVFSITPNRLPSQTRVNHLFGVTSKRDDVTIIMVKVVV